MWELKIGTTQYLYYKNPNRFSVLVSLYAHSGDMYSRIKHAQMHKKRESRGHYLTFIFLGSEY